MSQSLRDSQTGSIAADRGRIKGCMSEVLRSFFSYQVAVGNTMSEYMQVVDIRKSSVTRRSSFPSGASSCQVTSAGFFLPCSPRSFPSTPCLVPSRCLRKYSWPLPEAPNRLERQTNRLRGQFLGSSGSSQESRNSPDFSALATYSLASKPSAATRLETSSGLVLSCGADGSQPIRSARAL